jgi:hypothetical protein
MHKQNNRMSLHGSGGCSKARVCPAAQDTPSRATSRHKHVVAAQRCRAQAARRARTTSCCCMNMLSWDNVMHTNAPSTDMWGTCQPHGNCGASMNSCAVDIVVHMWAPPPQTCQCTPLSCPNGLQNHPGALQPSDVSSNQRLAQLPAQCSKRSAISYGMAHRSSQRTALQGFAHGNQALHGFWGGKEGRERGAAQPHACACGTPVCSHHLLDDSRCRCHIYTEAPQPRRYAPRVAHHCLAPAALDHQVRAAACHMSSHMSHGHMLPITWRPAQQCMEAQLRCVCT